MHAENPRSRTSSFTKPSLFIFLNKKMVPSLFIFTHALLLSLSFFFVTFALSQFSTVSDNMHDRRSIRSPYPQRVGRTPGLRIEMFM